MTRAASTVLKVSATLWLLVGMPAAAGAAPAGASATTTSQSTTSPAKPSSKRVGGKGDARSQAKAQVQKGQLDYKLGRFDQALEEYSRAYELFPAPALLFNLGQCHRNLKNYERAIFFFEGYLREQTKMDQDQRALTEDLLAECKTELARENAAAAVAAARFAAPPLRPVQPDLQGTVVSFRPEPSTSPAQLQIEQDQARSHRPLTHRWWFWTAVVGATVIAAGAAAYYTTGDPRLVAPSGSIGTLDRR